MGTPTKTMPKITRFGKVELVGDHDLRITEFCFNEGFNNLTVESRDLMVLSLLSSYFSDCVTRMLCGLPNPPTPTVSLPAQLKEAATRRDADALKELL